MPNEYESPVPFQGVHGALRRAQLSNVVSINMGYDFVNARDDTKPPPMSGYIARVTGP